jgi:Sodium:sulfate symporter transmembrane region
LRRGQFTLSWRHAANIGWGTILLFGGGLALGELMFSTGLAKWMGEGIARELQADTVLSPTMLFAALGTIMSETTGNTASAAMVVPVAIAVWQAAGGAADPAGAGGMSGRVARVYVACVHAPERDRLWFRIGPGPENDPARTGAGCGGLGGSGGGSDDDSAESAIRMHPFQCLTKLLGQQKFIKRRA